MSTPTVPSEKRASARHGRGRCRAGASALARAAAGGCTCRGLHVRPRRPRSPSSQRGEKIRGPWPTAPTSCTSPTHLAARSQGAGAARALREQRRSQPPARAQRARTPGRPSHHRAARAPGDTRSRPRIRESEHASDDHLQDHDDLAARPPPAAAASPASIKARALIGRLAPAARSVRVDGRVETGIPGRPGAQPPCGGRDCARDRCGSVESLVTSARSRRYTASMDPEAARRARAEARRRTATIRRARLQRDEVDLDPVRGAEGLTLVTRLTRESWTLSGREYPRYSRATIPCRFVPGRLT